MAFSNFQYGAKDGGGCPIEFSENVVLQSNSESVEQSVWKGSTGSC